MAEPQLELSFTGEPAFVEAVAAELSGDGMQVVGQAEVQEATDLNFDLASVAALVTIVQMSFFEGPLVPALLRVFRRTRPQRIKISSPFGEVTLEPSVTMTDEELRATMLKLATL
jgi:hypothetical protein